MTESAVDLEAWVGSTETAVDTVTPVPFAALAATLDRDCGQPAPGTPLPPPWHWLYFLPVVRHSQIGSDGHPARGGFMPPVALPRRMWAASRIEFREPVLVGDRLERRSSVTGVDRKSGRSGELVFVRVRHEIRRAPGAGAGAAGEPAIVEESDIVYRDAARPGQAAPEPRAAPATPADGWERRIVPDPVLLFRFSALTFNGHRIHYDQRYATGAEGYPGLVVHGPLIATLLLDALRDEHPQARVARFEFRALRPTFEPNHFFVCGAPLPGGGGLRLWARDHEGWLTMEASVALR